MAAVPGEVGAEAVAAGQIRVTWRAVKGAGAYRVYMAKDTADAFTLRATPGGVTYTATGLDAGAVYYFRASAVVNGVEGPVSQSAKAKAALSVTAAPTGLTASAPSPARVTVTWNRVRLHRRL